LSLKLRIAIGFPSRSLPRPLCTAAAAAAAAAVAGAAAYDAAIDANQQSLAAVGHWGVPTIEYNGEPFVGLDRVDTFLWRVAQER
jgi:2-hydroxychromene-2-carboxylate isomerase